MRLSLIREADNLNRRQFLQKAIGGASAMASMNLSTLPNMASDTANLASMLLGPEQIARLLETPEERWLGKLPQSQIQQIQKAAPDHGLGEIENKIAKAMSYGMLGKHHAHLPQTIKLLVKQWQVPKQRLADSVVSYMEYGFHGPADAKDIEVIKMLQHNFGVTQDNFAKSLQKQHLEPKVRQNIAKTLESAGIKVQVPENLTQHIRPDDEIYGSSMHQPFEHKLNTILNTLHG